MAPSYRPIDVMIRYDEPLDRAAVLAVTTKRIVMHNGRGEYRSFFGLHSTPIADALLIIRQHEDNAPLWMQ